ncbi:hypothetical protein PoB_002551000 [Plakobranchus ocellatus]|uniref:SMB domain-containing protein n=1 Tax=Plakobranchus ocellatus TaxID=259542 RepID=A0AAV3ZT66_9GAST|nr:hypothetical protein PoB_002551000 [Plakobranchus ocellatus]
MPRFFALLCVTLCTCFIIGESKDYEEVTTLDDLDPLVEKSPALLELLIGLCKEKRQTCANNCGARALPLHRQFVNHIGRIACSCDKLCMFYRDCCWDFVQACPAEAATYHSSSLRRSRPVWIGFHPFLVDTGSDGLDAVNSTGLNAVNSTSGADKSSLLKTYDKFKEDRQILTMEDVLDLELSGSVAVTDLKGGGQYRSYQDFSNLNPLPRSLPSTNTIVKWKPVLVASSRNTISEMAQLIQNKSSSFGDDIYFTFKIPDEFGHMARTIMPETWITCGGAEEAKQLRIRNLTQICTYFNESGDSGYRLNVTVTKPTTKTISFYNSEVKHTTEKGDNFVTKSELGTDRTLASTPKKNIFLAPLLKEAITSSTHHPLTHKTSSLQADPECSHYFALSLDSTSKSFAFSYLLNVQDSGSVSILANDFMSSWKEISCHPFPDGKLEGGTLVGQTEVDPPCETVITCSPGKLPIKDACFSPMAVLLQVTSVPGANVEDFQNAVVEAYNFSKILLHPQIRLALDPASCAINNTERSDKTNEINYYGIHHIFNLDRNFVFDGNELPFVHALTLSFNRLNMNNWSQASTLDYFKLCFVGRGDNSNSTAMFKTRKDVNDVLRQANHNRNPAERTFAKTACDEKPWAYRENAVFEDPNVKCKTVIITKNVWLRKPVRQAGCGLGDPCNEEEEEEEKEKNKSMSVFKQEENSVKLILAKILLGLIMLEIIGA